MRAMILAVLAGLSLATPGAAQTAAPAVRGDRDCPHCPEMIRILPGSFVMGAAVGEHVREGMSPDWATWELPRHVVTLDSGFSLGRHEVTRGQYAVFAGATGRPADPACHTIGADGKWADVAGKTWQDPGFRQTDRDPVTCVSWDDAKAYVAWLSRSSGRTYRLPSEAEWEYAARAGTTTARYWGDGHEAACPHANADDAAHGCSDGHVHTAPVGTFGPNPFGLHDMLGNVWEWTEDCWSGSYDGAPADGSARQSDDCKGRVLRGGAWVNKPWYVRAASRVAEPAGRRASDFGFRVARTD